jgi:hypothetical protein
MRIYIVFVIALTLAGNAAAQGAGARGQIPPPKPPVRPGADVVITETDVFKSQIAVLDERVRALEQQIAELQNRPAGAPSVPVNLTPDNAWPQKPPGEKADGLAQLIESVNNLWKAIDVIKSDLKKLNAR